MQYSKTKRWIITGIVTTLLLGFVLGVVTDRLASVRRYRRWAVYRGRTTKALAEERLLNRLSRKLNLTRPQIQAIGGILRIQSMKIKQLRKENKNKMKLIMKETREKIKPHITPRQQEKYDKLIALHRRRWKRISGKKRW